MHLSSSELRYSLTASSSDLTIPVSGELSSLLVKGSSLLGLVLDVLLLGRLLDCILVGLRLVGGCCSLLCRNHVGDALGEIGLDDLKHADDATASTFRAGVRLVSLGIIIVEDLQSKFDTLESLLQLRMVFLEGCLLIGTDLVHLCLSVSELSKLLLQLCNFLLQLGRLGLRGIEFG